MQPNRKILVIGATGGSGRAAVEQLLDQGHAVTAFSRKSGRLRGLSDRLTTRDGDATNMDDIDRAVEGQDAVIVTLGITENPLRVRLLGAAHTAGNVRSAGTRNVISAMQRHGVRRLVVQSSFGVGETRARLGLVNRLFFNLVLKPQIEDTQEQETAVRASGVDWVIAQPVHLTDARSNQEPYLSDTGETRAMKVTRLAVARFLVLAALDDRYIGKSVAVSG